MNRTQQAHRTQRAPERRSFFGALLLAVGTGTLLLVTAFQAEADEAVMDQAIFSGHAVVPLDDGRLAGIRGKFVRDEFDTTDAVILWDERPGGSGQGGNGAGDKGANSAQGLGNHQATRVTTHRSQ